MSLVTAPDLDLPPLVVQRARASGDVGEDWLAGLPTVLGALVARWGLTVGPVYAGGTAGCVVAATDGSGRDCVLKIAMPLDEEEHEAFTRSVGVHRIADGRGCAELYDHTDDATAPAMLLERLGPNLHDAGLPLDRLLETVATTLCTFWRPIDVADPAVDLPTGADKARWLARYIVRTWEELDRPCDRIVVDRALALCDDRAAAFDPDRSVLVHGDAHGWNVVAAGDGAHKLVDPEGIWSEPAHDLAVLMREYNEPLLAGDTPALVRSRADQLAAWCDVDPRPVWEWGFVERVSTGLASLRHFDGDGGLAFLEAARRCV